MMIVSALVIVLVNINKKIKYLIICILQYKFNKRPLHNYMAKEKIEKICQIEAEIADINLAR